jgi:hypothetical protein
MEKKFRKNILFISGNMQKEKFWHMASRSVENSKPKHIVSHLTHMDMF